MTLFERHPPADSGPPVGSRTPLHLATELGRSGAQVLEPAPSLRLVFETSSVIHDQRGELTVGGHQGNLHVVGRGVAGDVAEYFLQNREDMLRQRFVDQAVDRSVE